MRRSGEAVAVLTQSLPGRLLIDSLCGAASERSRSWNVVYPQAASIADDRGVKGPQRPHRINLSEDYVARGQVLDKLVAQVHWKSQRKRATTRKLTWRLRTERLARQTSTSASIDRGSRVLCAVVAWGELAQQRGSTFYSSEFQEVHRSSTPSLNPPTTGRQGARGRGNAASRCLGADPFELGR
jgi:hypothetical protein